MKIRIEKQRVRAYHGVLPLEQRVGAYFTVTTVVETDLTASCVTDELSDTVSYADIARVVTEEMAVTSKLLEHVAHRIASRLLSDFPMIKQATVSLLKENPPMGIECQGAGVEITLSRA